MNSLSYKDLELIYMERKAISKNYDKYNFKHTVDLDVRCQNSNVYIEVNVYSVLGVCSEMISIGSAIFSGEREFECIVAVRGENSEEILLALLGNCRQLLNDYISHGDVVINTL